MKRRADFSLVYQRGTRFKTAHLTLRVLRRSPTGRSTSTKAIAADKTSPDETPTRIGISISLKVDKRAVIRNRIRRRIQAIFRQLLPHISPGLDLLIVAHPEAVQCDSPQFLQELKQLLIDAEVLNGYSGGCVL